MYMCVHGACVRGVHTCSTRRLHGEELFRVFPERGQRGGQRAARRGRGSSPRERKGSASWGLAGAACAGGSRGPCASVSEDRSHSAATAVAAGAGWSPSAEAGRRRWGGCRDPRAALHRPLELLRRLTHWDKTWAGVGFSRQKPRCGAASSADCAGLAHCCARVNGGSGPAWVRGPREVRAS